MGIGFFRRKAKTGDTQSGGQQPGDGPRGGGATFLGSRGKMRGGKVIDDGLIQAVSSKAITKVLIAPWSYSRKEVQDKMDKYRIEHSKKPSRHMMPGDLMLGDTEGLWGTKFHMNDGRVREQYQRRLGLSEREEARLERILYEKDAHRDECPLTRILGRSRYRCRKSMGANRWNEFMSSEKKTLKEHVSMLERKWGRRFVDSCQRWIAADTPPVKRRETEQGPYVDPSCKNTVRPNRMGIKIVDEGTVVGSLREKYDLNVGKSESTTSDHKNAESFRILARPTSAA